MKTSVDLDPLEATGSHALLRRRAECVPDILEAVLATEICADFQESVHGRCVFTTGAGLADGAARFLAATLLDGGQAAQFLPLSQLLERSWQAPSQSTLVLFSQGLSPNARIAMRADHGFQNKLLVTSAVADDDSAHGPLLDAWTESGGRVLVVPPREEGGIFLRIQGPVASTLASLRIADQLLGPSRAQWEDLLKEVPVASRQAYLHASEETTSPRLRPDVPIALVTFGGYRKYCRGLRWKLLEAFWSPSVHIFDALQIAHGPFQAFYDLPFQFVFLKTARDSHELLRRVSSMLVPERHTVFEITSTLAPPLAYFHHDSALNAMILKSLQSTQRHLGDWPGRDLDAAIYEIGSTDEPL
jgi:hypothetical protein